MPIRQRSELREADGSEPAPGLTEVVLGLHWDPARDANADQVADLDAVCVMLDGNGEILEVVHPGHPRSANASVIHTGDARTGASEWDDERIFVFLEAVPEAVSRLAFVVVSATGISFDAIPGARCHVSDRISEVPRVRVDLTSLRGRTAHAAAILGRGLVGWHVATPVATDERWLCTVQKLLVHRAK